MNQLFNLVQMCWEADSSRSQEQCLKVVLQLGTKLYDNRSPFYNILRKYYGLYGHPLELVLFETPPPVSATSAPASSGAASSASSSAQPASAAASAAQATASSSASSAASGPPEKLTRSSSDLRARLAMLNTEGKDALEEQFLGASLGTHYHI
jgi:hypothetical protein